MNGRTRVFVTLALAVACALAASATAVAATTHSKLRVEAAGRALDPGTNYSNKSIRVAASDDCGGDQRSGRALTRGANALGLIGHGARVRGSLRPFTVGVFDFGRMVCEVNGLAGAGNSFWQLTVNHELSPVGGEARSVGRSDEVLWTLVQCLEFNAQFECVRGSNSGQELELRGVPHRMRPGTKFRVRAIAYTPNGRARPAQGVRVNGAPLPTNANGRTTVTTRSQPGTMRLRGTRGEDIPTAPVALCVNQRLSRCPSVRGERFVGTATADRILGTRGADTIRARGGADQVSARRGDDTVNVRGGGRDNVNCGPGRDVVIADRRDDIRGNCERVRR